MADYKFVTLRTHRDILGRHTMEGYRQQLMEDLQSQGKVKCQNSKLDFVQPLITNLTITRGNRNLRPGEFHPTPHPPPPTSTQSTQASQATPQAAHSTPQSSPPLLSQTHTPINSTHKDQYTTQHCAEAKPQYECNVQPFSKYKMSILILTRS